MYERQASEFLAALGERDAMEIGGRCLAPILEAVVDTNDRCERANVCVVYLWRKGGPAPRHAPIAWGAWYETHDGLSIQHIPYTYTTHTYTSHVPQQTNNKQSRLQIAGAQPPAKPSIFRLRRAPAVTLRHYVERLVRYVYVCVLLMR